MTGHRDRPPTGSRAGRPAPPLRGGPYPGPTIRSRRTGRLARRLVVVVALLASACGAPASQPLEGGAADAVRAALDSGTAAFDHARWDSLLAGGVRDGLVDYPYFQRHRSALDAYLDRVAAAEMERLAPAHLKALLINAYNAYTVRVILENPGVSSIREIDGVWTETTHPVGGHELTLDQIEHNLLRPFFRDPRIHFAVNCASRSCAPLPPWAFGGDALDVQLEERTRAFLRDTTNVRVADGTLLLSRYFDWYGPDFTDPEWSPRAATIPAFVARYAGGEVARLVERHGGDPPVEFLEYDWSLNAAVPPATGDAAAPARIGDGALARAPAAHPAPVPSTAGRAPARAAALPDLSTYVRRFRKWVEGLGPAAPIVYAVAYALATVAMVPGSALTVGAGVAFGLVGGTAVSVAGSVTGATGAFLVARYLLRDRVSHWVEEREKFAAVDEAVAREGWKVVALTRLSPVFPFNFLNYAYGLTRVRFGPYVAASAAAMFPGTVMYVYAGVAGRNVAAAATGAAGWGRTALQVAGLLATVAVVVLVTRAARRELREATGVEGLEGAADAERVEDGEG